MFIYFLIIFILCVMSCLHASATKHFPNLGSIKLILSHLNMYSGRDVFVIHAFKIICLLIHIEESWALFLQTTLISVYSFRLDLTAVRHLDDTSQFPLFYLEAAADVWITRRIRAASGTCAGSGHSQSNMRWAVQRMYYLFFRKNDYLKCQHRVNVKGEHMHKHVTFSIWLSTSSLPVFPGAAQPGISSLEQCSCTMLA